MQAIIENNLKIYDSVKQRSPENSYTVLSTLNDSKTGQLLALATGTQASLKTYPDDIEDCHAESLVKRAFKRHIMDLLHLSNLPKRDVIKRIEQYDLVLFISQFPCGLIRRYQGDEPKDERTGAELERKPGRGQEKQGEMIYVQRSSCTNKLRRWISSFGMQGRRFHEVLGIKCLLKHIVIGQCECDANLNYELIIEKLSQFLDNQLVNISFVPIRREEFVFDVYSKKPRPVSVVCWSSIDAELKAKLSHEYVVDGRKMGLTKRACSSQPTGGDGKSKLKIGDYWLRRDVGELKAV